MKMLKSYNLIFLLSFSFILSCTNNQLSTISKPTNNPTSSINPNTSVATNTQMNNINVNNDKPCIGQSITISGDNFSENIGNEVKIWIQSSNPNSSEKLPPLYEFSYQLGKVIIDPNGKLNFTFQLKDRYVDELNRELRIESKKKYIIYVEYGTQGGNFKGIGLDIC